MEFDNTVNINNLDLDDLNYFTSNNKNNYNYKKIVSDYGIFDVDATYVINLENNGRLKNILNEIKNFPCSKNIYIVINKGFKNCKKDDWVKTSVNDIIHCNYNVLLHSKEHKYKNILILEDDCLFSKDIISHKENINNFINYNKDSEFQYYLGCIPLISVPYNKNTYYNKLSSGTHAIIFSKKMQNKILTINPETISDWDVFNNYMNFTRYLYYKPLCYQLFPETENYKNWGINSNILVNYFGNIIGKNLIKIFKLDVQVEPGYSFFYNFSKFFFVIILISIIYFFLYTMYFIIKYLNNKKSYTKKLYKLIKKF